MENHYDFRKRLDAVHKPNIVDPTKKQESGETRLDASWTITFDGPPVEGSAAWDLRDFCEVSLGFSLPVGTADRNVVRLEEVPGDKGFDWKITPDSITLRGNARRGVYWLEDTIRLREAPFLKQGSGRRDPIFTPRMTHSGWGLDLFPDSYLNAIAHAGFDHILLYVNGVDQTTFGHLDFNDVIRRAEKFGLGVYFYSYLNSFKHPSDPDAEEFFDRNFGEVFKNCKGVKGLILVGESCQFPSKDPRVRPGPPGRGGGQIVSDPRAVPGFFPADDYPQWLEAVKKAVRKYQPDVDVVFWTYNWGSCDKALRLALIDKLPLDISLEVTFEMYQKIPYENHLMRVPDYTITFPGPGDYFTSEAEAAARRKLPLYTITNTAGATWDCGVLPYIPVPQQWFKRFRSMLEAHRKWNLTGIMDSHHYGWFPGPVAECAKWCFWSPGENPDEILRKIARRDFGADAAEKAVEAWRLWSDAMNSFTPGFDDQCGPLRIGPSYPFVFQPILYPYTEQKMVFPYDAHAYRGYKRGILTECYQPEHVGGHTNIGRRIREDIRLMSHARDLWGKGVECMDEALAMVPESKREEAEFQANIGKFFHHTLRTLVGIKRWWLLNKRLEIEYDFDTAHAILDEMEAIARDEMENVKETIPLAEKDSRLGWEPTMEYVTDRKRLEWKLERLNVFLNATLKAYRATVGKQL